MTEPPPIDDVGQNRHDLVHNERAKLTATWLNNLGVGAIVAGFIAQSISMSTSAERSTIALVATVWIPIGVALNLLGRRVLRGLKPWTAF